IAQVKQQSNLQEGLRRLEAAIAKHRPTRSEAYFELGEAYWRAGQSAKAIPAYEQAVGREPSRWYHFSSLGIALPAEQPQRALEMMERARKLAPREPAITYALGEIYVGMGRLRDAESTFRKAWEINPERAEAPNNLGTTLLKLGALSGAES